jgi:DNA invertase Pin-like site-specific DNA recombinase
MKKIAIYYRVSTDKQDIASQKYSVERYLEELKTPPQKMEVFEELGMSGKDHKRPEFRRLMQGCMKGKFDTIVVYKLDRFSRDASMAIRTLLELDEFGVGFVSVTQPVLNLGHDNPFRRTLLAAFAELAEIERETIVARVKSGLAAAKKRGVRLGAPPKYNEDTIRKVKALREDGNSFGQIADLLDIPKGSVYRYAQLSVDP